MKLGTFTTVTKDRPSHELMAFLLVLIAIIPIAIITFFGINVTIDLSN